MASRRAAQADLEHARRAAQRAEAAVAAAEAAAAKASEALARARERAQAERWRVMKAEHAVDAAQRSAGAEPPRRAHGRTPLAFPERHADRSPRRAATTRPARAAVTRPTPPDGPPSARAEAHRAKRAPTARDRAAALAALQDLLPDRITARFGRRQRELPLAAGDRYRVAPLNRAKKRNLGRVGRLLTWDVSGSEGVLAWDDGGDRERVPLADLEPA